MLWLNYSGLSCNCTLWVLVCRMSGAIAWKNHVLKDMALNLSRSTPSSALLALLTWTEEVLTPPLRSDSGLKRYYW